MKLLVDMNLSPRWIGVLASVAAKRKQGERAPQIRPTKQLVSVRYSPEVLAYFKSDGSGWKTRMNEARKKRVHIRAPLIMHLWGA